MADHRLIWSLVADRARATPDARFAVDEQDRALTFAQFCTRAERTAAGLVRQGVEPGATVSYVLPTRIETMILCAALARIGTVQNPILPAYREREFGFVLTQARPALVLLGPAWRGFDHAAVARGLGARVLTVDGALPEADPAALPLPPDDPERISFLFYTSGTTADPKGVRHRDRSILAAAVGLADALALTPGDRHALVFPFAHIGGVLWLAAGLRSGASQIVCESFDARAIAVLGRHGVTLAGAGTVFHQAYLRAQRERPGERLFPALRACPGGGAPKPAALHLEVARELGGVGIVSGYGLTECPAVTMNRPGDAADKLAETEGRPSPGAAEIRIEDAEILVRGPQLFAGYLDTALDCAAFDGRGFFRTGDLGVLDRDGYLTVTGRKKDVIIRKGENISAQEVEALLAAHPQVAEVALIGLPDPQLGERCCAVVVARPGDAPALPELAAFLRARGLMVQKIPEQLELIDALPRNPLGKVDKRTLRARFVA
jgi:acyl-CoA synthetase (AMP-forming)/AMP-acid ligase II